MPSIFSLWVIRKSHQQTNLRLRQAANSVPRGRMLPMSTSDASDRYYLEGVGYLIGDITCQFNARSGYLRCAVNPDGPCEGCRFYEEKQYLYNEQKTF